MTTWKRAMIIARKEACKPPKDGFTLDQIAEDMGLSRERARKEVTRLIRMGKAEMIPGKLVTESGNMLNTTFYRLLKETGTVKKTKE